MNSKPIEIRIPGRIGSLLKREVSRRGTHEYVAFGLAGSGATADRLIILVKEIILLREDQYVSSAGHGAAWRGSSTIELFRRALASKLGIIVFHAHMHKGQVGFSSDDLESAERLLPAYQNLVPERPHGFVVLGLDSVCGTVLLPESERFHQVARARWFDERMIDWGNSVAAGHRHTTEQKFDRQRLVVGIGGQEILGKTRLAVVGLGGGGSHVVQQAAHMGIGEIIGIDADIGEEGNRNRLIGLKRCDVRLRRRKTSVMTRLVRSINSHVRFTPVPFNIPEARAIEQLKRADVVVGCVDTLHARSDIQDICSRFVIPYIDIGLLIVPTTNGSKVQGIGGNVLTSIPGRSCLWCMGYLSQGRLDQETGGRPRSYIRGSTNTAQVVSFNGLLASSALSAVLQILTGFASTGEPSQFLKFNGMRGTLEEWHVQPDPSCKHCSSSLGSGDPVWEEL